MPGAGKPFEKGDPRINRTKRATGGGAPLGNKNNPHGNPSTQFGAGNNGRPAGSKNRATLGKEFAAKEGLTDKERPLAFFIAMMKGVPFKVRKLIATGEIVETDYHPTLEDMKWGAAMAAPYMHPKLANIQHSGDVTVTHENFLDQLVDEDGDSAVRH